MNSRCRFGGDRIRINSKSTKCQVDESNMAPSVSTCLLSTTYICFRLIRPSPAIACALSRQVAQASAAVNERCVGVPSARRLRSSGCARPPVRKEPRSVSERYCSAR